jgi:hypothetical protein
LIAQLVADSGLPEKPWEPVFIKLLATPNAICAASCSQAHFSREPAYSGARAFRSETSEIFIKPANGWFSSKIK